MTIKVVVIGGGIAGVSAAYALADHASKPEVVLVEAESQLAYHSTGRSAAQYIENYGAMPVRALTKASHQFLANPPDGLADAPLLSNPRAVLTIGDAAACDSIDRSLAEGLATNPAIRELTQAECLDVWPLLRPEAAERGVLEPNGKDIDVAGLHQAFVRGLRRAGGSLRVSTRVDSAVPEGTGWRVSTTEGTIGADIVVNCAGAWADVVATTAGLRPVGLVPKRRTAFMVASPHPESHSWPLLAQVNQEWYLKPDGSQFMGSLADETPSEPVDAKPLEVDIALAIQRINDATTLSIRAITSSWAGLRSFVADRAMVVGPDPENRNFIWCAGQGGTGIQTAPAAGQLVADLALDGGARADLMSFGLDQNALSASRPSLANS